CLIVVNDGGNSKVLYSLIGVQRKLVATLEAGPLTKHRSDHHVACSQLPSNLRFVTIDNVELLHRGIFIRANNENDVFCAGFRADHAQWIDGGNAVDG